MFRVSSTQKLYDEPILFDYTYINISRISPFLFQLEIKNSIIKNKKRNQKFKIKYYHYYSRRGAHAQIFITSKESDFATEEREREGVNPLELP